MSDRGGWTTMDMFLAVLGGAAIGASVAYLTTTMTGEKRKKQLMGYVDTGKEKIDEYVTMGRDKARAFPDAVKSGASAARESFVETMRNG